MSILLTFLSGTAEGLWWAILTIGVYITYRLLDFADLTVEGSLPLGAAVTAVMINAGVNPILAVLISFLAGCAAGFSTGILNTLCKIPPILAGILTMIALYSVNLRIMSDKATVTITSETLKEQTMSLLKISNVNLNSVVIGVIFCAVIIAVLYLFFGTEIGAAIRATGQNKNMSRALGINTNVMTVIALMISNGLVALSGSLIAQFDYGSAIVTMGQGSIVIGLASVIIGEVIFCHKDHNFAYKLSAMVFGAIIYRCIIAFALRINIFKATDLKIMTAVIVAFALSLPVIKEKLAIRKMKIAHIKENAAQEGKKHA